MFAGASTRGSSGISSSSSTTGVSTGRAGFSDDAHDAAVRHHSLLNLGALIDPGASRCSGWLCARRRRRHRGQSLRARHDDNAREPRRRLGGIAALAREVPGGLLQQDGQCAGLGDIGEIERDGHSGRCVPVDDARAAHAFPFGKDLPKRDVLRNQRHAAVQECEAQIPGEGEARYGRARGSWRG